MFVDLILRRREAPSRRMATSTAVRGHPSRRVLRTLLRMRSEIKRFTGSRVTRRNRRRYLGLLDALEAARIGRLFEVGVGIVFPELRHIRIGFDRHVPVFAVGTLDALADVDVVDRVAL